MFSYYLQEVRPFLQQEEAAVRKLTERSARRSVSVSKRTELLLTRTETGSVITVGRKRKTEKTAAEGMENIAKPESADAK